jgi:hypothetical protein
VAGAGGHTPGLVTVAEKAGSDCKIKAGDSDRISRFSHRGKRLQRATPNTTDISKFVVTFVVTQALFGAISDAFTYEKRRGRESNPRIAVLQTATLPLGYPADGEKMQTIPIWRLGVNVRRQFENRSII